MQQYKMSRTSLVTITAENERFILMRNMGMIMSVLEIKKFCILKTYFYTVEQIKLIFFSCV